jgi:hypothetical protein
MRKRLITPTTETVRSRGEGWLDVESAAGVEVTSEYDDSPVESALVSGVCALQPSRWSTTLAVSKSLAGQPFPRPAVNVDLLFGTGASMLHARPGVSPRTDVSVPSQ